MKGNNLYYMSEPLVRTRRSGDSPSRTPWGIGGGDANLYNYVWNGVRISWIPRD